MWVSLSHFKSRVRVIPRYWTQGGSRWQIGDLSYHSTERPSAHISRSSGPLLQVLSRQCPRHPRPHAAIAPDWYPQSTVPGSENRFVYVFSRQFVPLTIQNGGKTVMSGLAGPESKTAFISGPIEFPDDFFAKHYEPLLKEAISLGHSFVMGPALGTDSTSLKRLLDHGVEPSRITVYLAEFEERTLAKRIKWFTELGGNVKVEGMTTSDRDAAMTRDSDYDILRYMTIEEQKAFYGERYFPRVSATEKNDRRRKGLPLHVNHGLVGYESKGVKVGDIQTAEGLGTLHNSIWTKRVKKFFKKSSARPD